MSGSAGLTPLTAGGIAGQTARIRRTGGRLLTITGICLTLTGICVPAGTGGTVVYATRKTVPGTGTISIRRQVDRLRARAGGAGRMGPWKCGL